MVHQSPLRLLLQKIAFILHHLDILRRLYSVSELERARNFGPIFGRRIDTDRGRLVARSAGDWQLH